MKKLIKELQGPLLYEKIELSHRIWCVCVHVCVYCALFEHSESHARQKRQRKDEEDEKRKQQKNK